MTRPHKRPTILVLAPSRHTRSIENAGYPSLVIETGVSESLSRLRQDARKWFADSGGDVPIVILIHASEKIVSFEQWQLAPSTAPRPLTKRYIDTLWAQTPPKSHRSPDSRHNFSKSTVSTKLMPPETLLPECRML
ncbi:hypothetical protein N7501_005537 [Penicillium viridicatum]|nr:hypothetical protein N7501_005537 [Penicillium viridicatum]